MFEEAFYRGGLVCFAFYMRKLYMLRRQQCQGRIPDPFFSNNIRVYLYVPHSFCQRKGFFLRRFTVSSTRERLRIKRELSHLCVCH